MPATPAPSSTESQPVPFDDVAAFTRKLIHDMRNGLNALDLQLAAVLDLAEDDGASSIREDMSVARRLLNDEARRLSQISSQLRQRTPEMIEYGAADLIEDLRGRVDHSLTASPPIEWTDEGGSGKVAVDFELLSAAVLELVRNAIHFSEGGGAVRVVAGMREGRLSIEIIQPRAGAPEAIESWGSLPFRTTRRGTYGLGLFAARRSLAAIGAVLEFEHIAAAGELRTRLTLPLT